MAAKETEEGADGTKKGGGEAKIPKLSEEKKCQSLGELGHLLLLQHLNVNMSPVFVSLCQQRGGELCEA